VIEDRHLSRCDIVLLVVSDVYKALKYFYTALAMNTNMKLVTSEITPPATQRRILNLQPRRCEDLTSLNSISVCDHA